MKWEGKQQDFYIVPAQYMCICDRVTFQVNNSIINPTLLFLFLI